jgi:SAM-dependent methyltransferase
VHLQCHIGTDTLSLARLGAAHVAGLDLSPASLREARSLADQAAGGEKMSFVEGDVYAAPELLGEGEWDVVFTGIGALGWLPDIQRWVSTVAALLKPQGELFIREGHPILFAIGDKDPGKLVVEYPYFETAEPIVSDEPSTYVRLEMEGKKFEARTTVEWNHGLGEIVSALLGVGMRITMLEEHRSVPWNALPGQMVDVGGGEL